VEKNRLIPHESTDVNEELIGRLVRAFYGRARADARSARSSMPRSSIGSTTSPTSPTSGLRSFCRPGATPGARWAHLVLPLRDEHFDRWLMIFEKTAREQFTAEAADIIVDRARRIADSFEMGIASRRGEIVSPRHTFSAAPTSG